MSVVGRLHERTVYGRRVRVLCEALSALLPPDARVLDVGCGDGRITRQVADVRPDLRISGIDVKVRRGTYVPVDAFDGTTIPYEDRAFDAVMMVDVLHHTDDPSVLLREAARVASGTVVLKDHTLQGRLAGPTLRFMDWFGNAPHGVALPYTYWTRDEWQRTFDALGLRVETWRDSLPLYPAPASWIFGRSLHFLARLTTPGRRAHP